LAGRFFGTDLSDFGRVGSGTMRMSPIGNGLGDGGNGLACGLPEQPNRRSLVP